MKINYNNQEKDCNICEIFYVTLCGNNITKIWNKHKTKRETEETTRENHQPTKIEGKIKNGEKKQPEGQNQNDSSEPSCISGPPNVNGWTPLSNGTEWPAGLKKQNKPHFMLCTGDSFQLWKHTQTKSERMEDNILSKQEAKGGRYSPGWCGSVDWAPDCEPNGCHFDFQSGHMSGLRARSPAHRCFLVSPSLPLSLKIKTFLKRND